MNELKAFGLDLLEGALLGGAVATLALPESVGWRAAVALIALGAVKAVTRVAIARLVAFRDTNRSGS